jgi:hypothetical protein
MIRYAISQAKCWSHEIILVSDWAVRHNQLPQKNLTYIQVEQKHEGNNSLDHALCNSVRILYRDGISRFILVTSDGDFADIVMYLSRRNCYIFGIGSIRTSDKLRLSMIVSVIIQHGSIDRITRLDNVIPAGQPCTDVATNLIAAYKYAIHHTRSEKRSMRLGWGKNFRCTYFGWINPAIQYTYCPPQDLSHYISYRMPFDYYCLRHTYATNYVLRIMEARYE